MAAPRPRDYQEAALSAIIQKRDEGYLEQLLVLATGLGKTVVFCSLVPRLNLERFDVLLAVAHSEELIDQAANAFRKIVPDAWLDIEMAGRRASPMAKIVVASVQTLKGKRSEEFFRRFSGRIAALVIDEAHRAASKSYRALIEQFRAASPQGLLLGVTATPRRSDNVGLDAVFKTVAYHMGIREAIEQGYLCPIEAYRVQSTTSLETIKTTAGDWAKDELAAAVDTELRNQLVIDSYLKRANGKRGVVFAASVEHARRLADDFVRAGVPADAVYGEMDGDRKAVLEKLRTGELRIVTNYGLLVEGVDVPGVEVVVLARPTQSGVVYTQAVGRGLRPHPDIAHLLTAETTADERRALIASSPKPSAIIIDVVDVTTKQSLVTLPSLFGLPPKLDPQGKKIGDVISAWEAAVRKNPKRAHEALTFAELSSSIERVDPFAVPSISPDVAGISHLTWFESTAGVYRIGIPTITVARDRAGVRIDRFEPRLRAQIERARSRGVEDPEAEAYAALNVNERTIARVDVCVEIRPDALGQFEFWASLNGKWVQRGSYGNQAEAFSQTEAWIRRNFPETLSVLARGASWKKAEPTEGQLWKLQRLGVPKDRIPATKGECSALIDKLTSTAVA